MTFSGTKKVRFGTMWGLKRPNWLIKRPFGIPFEALEVQKWTNDAYPANIGQLDHYVVFGTKSGAIQDF